MDGGGARPTDADDLAAVGEVRGKGLMFAVDLVDPATKQPSPPLASRMLEATKERGLLIGKGGLVGNTLRMAPPLTLTEIAAGSTEVETDTASSIPRDSQIARALMRLSRSASTVGSMTPAAADARSRPDTAV